MDIHSKIGYLINKIYSTYLVFKKNKYNFQVPPRFELGSLDSKSRVLTITPWDRYVYDFLLQETIYQAQFVHLCRYFIIENEMSRILKPVATLCCKKDFWVQANKRVECSCNSYLECYNQICSFLPLQRLYTAILIFQLKLLFQKSFLFTQQ